MEQRYCFSCFTPLEPDASVCPVCGYDPNQEEPSHWQLDKGTILQSGKYLVGRAVSDFRDGWPFSRTSIRYTGLLLQKNYGQRRVYIREYYDCERVYRAKDSNFLEWKNPEEQLEKCEWFIRFAQNLIARKEELTCCRAIVPVLDCFLENQTAYIVTDLREGESLYKRIMDNGPMTLSECLPLMGFLMQDISKIHERGIVHLSIHPKNITISPSKEINLYDLEAPSGSEIAEISPYSAPELFADYDPKGSWSDVYSVCAVILFCLTARNPPNCFEREKDGKGAQADYWEVGNEWLKWINPRIRQVLDRGISLDAKNRIQTMAGLYNTLQQAFFHDAPSDYYHSWDLSEDTVPSNIDSWGTNPPSRIAHPTLPVIPESVSLSIKEAYSKQMKENLAIKWSDFRLLHNCIKNGGYAGAVIHLYELYYDPIISSEESGYFFVSGNDVVGKVTSFSIFPTVNISYGNIFLHSFFNRDKLYQNIFEGKKIDLTRTVVSVKSDSDDIALINFRGQTCNLHFRNGIIHGIKYKKTWYFYKSDVHAATLSPVLEPKGIRRRVFSSFSGNKSHVFLEHMLLRNVEKAVLLSFPMLDLTGLVSQRKLFKTKKHLPKNAEQKWDQYTEPAQQANPPAKDITATAPTEFVIQEREQNR